jgi:lysophospholipase L1-like esterase
MQARPGAAGRVLLAALLGSALVLLPSCSSSGSAGPPTSSSTTSATPSDSSGDSLHLVAIGDSIPYNSPDACPGCTGFVEQYADAVSAAVGRPVTVENLSQYTGLTLPQLLDELDSFEDQISAADIVLVGIAHNSNELNADAPCGKPLVAGKVPDWPVPDWSAMTRECAQASTAAYEPQYDDLYTQVAAMRAGKPTILRTINRYNDWIGVPSYLATITPAQGLITKRFIDPWSAMICRTAKAHGFGCADIYHAFNGPHGTRASGDLVGSDYTHPSQSGNDLISQQLEALGYAPLA